MSASSKSTAQDTKLDFLTDKFNSSTLSGGSEDKDKPDFKELDLDSPVSPLMTRSSAVIKHGGAASSASSSSSSGSFSGKTTNTQMSKQPENASNNHSGELSETSPHAFDAVRSANTGGPSKPGHRRSVSAGAPLIYSGKTFASSSGNSNVYGSPSVLPSGNICPSGKTKPSMVNRSQVRTDTLCSGTGNYGHGNIIRGGAKLPSGSGNSGDSNVSGSNVHLAEKSLLIKQAMGNGDPEEVKKIGNELYRRGHFVEALSLYDRAISLSPSNAAYRSNRAAALTMLGRLDEAVKECESAVRLDPGYGRAHQRLSSLYLRLGQVQNARQHIGFSGQKPDQSELQKLNSLENNLKRCSDARKTGDWKVILRETDAAIENGAKSCPQIIACRAEAFLKLHQFEEAESTLLKIPKFEQYPLSCSQTRFFGILSEAYVFYVRALIDMALGRFENAVAAAEKAGLTDCTSIDISKMLYNVKKVANARARGKTLFDAGKYEEACSAYGEGLKYDNSNYVLYNNRAVCWYKHECWEQCVEDCNQVLRILPNNTKALNLRAVSCEKLGRWAEAIKDFEVLNRKLPEDNNIIEALSRVQQALKKSHRDEDHRMNSGSEVKEVSNLEKFKAAISSGTSVVYFKEELNELCEELSPFLNMLCMRYPSIRFFKVDVEESLSIRKAECIRAVPTIKIFRNGEKVMEMLRPSHHLLENSVRSCSV